MDFVAVVDQVIALLRQRGRLTYRMLKRQFELDDTVLEDLKEELIYGQRLVVDEDERVLVWMGDVVQGFSALCAVGFSSSPVRSVGLHSVVGSIENRPVAVVTRVIDLA